MDRDTAVYDYFGKIVVPKGSYVYFNITAKINNISDPGMPSKKEYIEIIETRKYDSPSPTITKYILDPISYERTIYKGVEDEYLGLFDQDITELRDYGLDGYYLKVIKDAMYLYDKDNKLINKMYYPDYDTFTIIDGKFIYQKKYLLDYFANDYTFIQNGSKYLLISTSIDILSLKETKLKLPYLIKSIKPIYNEDKIYTHANATINKIEKKILHESSVKVLIDSKAKIVDEMASFLFIRFSKA